MKTVTRAILAIGLICCCGCGSAREPAKHSVASQQAVTPPPEPAPHEFLSAVIRSLATSQRGLKMVNEAAAAQSTMADLMTANQNATIEVRMAEALVEPYGTSRDSIRRDGARYILSAYKMYEHSLAIQLAGLEAADSATTAESLKGMSRRISDAKVAYQQGSSILISAVGIAFGSTVIAAPNDTLHTALDMSAAERRALVAEVDSLMGKLPSGGTGASGPVSAAILLRDKLDQWRVAR